MSKFDILGLGVMAVDEIAYVPHFPAPDTKLYMTGHVRVCGGLAGRSLLQASRLGMRCAYAGMLDDSESAQFLRAAFRDADIDTTHSPFVQGARPVEAIIIAEQQNHSRTILTNAPEIRGAHPALPPESFIRECRLVFVDHYGIPGMTRAAEIARRHGIPVVADIERNPGGALADLIELVDHLILPAGFACEWTGTETPEAAAAALRAPHHQLVAVTAGNQGCWWAEGKGPLQQLPAFPVQSVDTTGCGDVFHAAYAFALLQQRAPLDSLRFASAAAAVKATRRAEEPLPLISDIETFLAGQT